MESSALIKSEEQDHKKQPYEVVFNKEQRCNIRFLTLFCLVVAVWSSYNYSIKSNVLWGSAMMSSWLATTCFGTSIACETKGCKTTKTRWEKMLSCFYSAIGLLPNNEGHVDLDSEPDIE